MDAVHFSLNLPQATLSSASPAGQAVKNPNFQWTQSSS
jgi:hypothetical protein